MSELRRPCRTPRPACAVSEARRPSLYTIPAHGAFADRLAEGLLAGHPFGAASSTDELSLARTTVLLPSRRAVRALNEAFVRAAGGALLLPKLIVLGDLEDDFAPGVPTDAESFSRWPQIGALERTMRLMPLVEHWQERTGQSRAKVETWRLAEALGRALDLVQLHGVDGRDLPGAVEGEMAAHWQRTVQFLDIVIGEWPGVLTELGMSDRVTERQAELRRLTARWQAHPPAGPMIAAGIASADPAAAALLGAIARLPGGAVVFPGLDLDMPEEEWDRLSPTGPHPQVPMKLLLEGMEVRRGEVDLWPGAGTRDGEAERTPLLAAAFQPPARTADWHALSIPAPKGMTRFEAASPAEEASGIALALRRALTVPEKTAALVTPDRDLARRVAAQMRRWGIDIDDSAGQPLSLTPPGGFMRLALEAAASGFAPVPLMALLKHPLAGPPAEARGDWLIKVRRLDLALRGVRPARGLQGVRNRLTTTVTKDEAGREALIAWWKDIETKLRPVATLFQQRTLGNLGAAAAHLRTLIESLSDERFLAGQAGRAAAEMLAELERLGPHGGAARAADLPAFLGAVLGTVAVRPAYGRHPRLAIYGLLEARLQRADLMILGGLNEGVWPPSDTFDPWLPPKVRAALGLPPTDRALALSAHDFVQACGAPEVLLTRSKRDASAPTVASRFWLRLDALLGSDLPRDGEIAALASALDSSETRAPAPRPEPAPPVDERPREISVTEVETLRADPFQFYAKRLLRLSRLDALGEKAGPAQRGTIVHDLMETLSREGALGDEVRRAAAIETALRAYSDHPLMTALWQPRVERMLGWAAEQFAALEARQVRIAAVERWGEMPVDGVRLKGKADVIFDTGAGVAIADYKTGQPPAPGRIAEGYADQLALLAWMAEAGAFDDLDKRTVEEIAYWRLSGGERQGTITSSTNKRMRKDNVWRDLPAYFEEARERFRQTIARWLTGNAPFTARLRPEFAPYNDYEQLARVQEWEGEVRG